MSGPRENLEGLNDLSDDERHLERLLAALPPRESRIKRDQTMYLAGQASAAPLSQTRRSNRWVWPAGTICSTAAGLLAGVVISALDQRGTALPPTRSAREEVIERREPILVERVDRDDKVADGESPSLLDLRVRMASRAGDEFLLAQVDPLAQAERLTAGRPRGADPPVAVTYGQFLGRLFEIEDHQ